MSNGDSVAEHQDQGVAVILASASPRRAQLLEQLGVRFTQRPSPIDERRATGEHPTDYVRRMAISKALAAPLESPQALCSEKVYQEKVSVEETHSEKFYTVSARAQNGVLAPQCVILASDTTVVVEGECLGKPVDEADFMRMMQALSGQRHEVHTAVSVRNAQRQDTFLCTSSVWFRPTSLAERQAYWQTGEPADKAGGYAIQGIGAAFVARLDGSYSAVMGLPLRETASLLTEFGVGWALSEVPTSKSGLTGLPIGSTSDPSDDSVTGGPYKH